MLQLNCTAVSQSESSNKMDKILRVDMVLGDAGWQLETFVLIWTMFQGPQLRFWLIWTHQIESNDQSHRDLSYGAVRLSIS